MASAAPLPTRTLPTLGPVAPDAVSGLTPDHPLPGSWYRNGFVRLLVFVLLFAGMTAVVSALVPRPASAGTDSMLFATIQLVLSLLAYAALLAFEGRRHPVELAPRRWSGVLTGLAIGTIGMLLVFVLAVVCGARTIEGLTPERIDWVLVYMVGPVAGISEEIIFRGVLFRLLESWVGTWGSTAVSAVVFGFVHLSNPHATLAGAIGIALEAGVMFALLYAWTRSLWVVMGVHAAWNVVQGPVLGSAISGATRDGQGLVNSHAAGPDLLSGGIFGLEASILAVGLWLVFSVWLGLRIHRLGLAVAPTWVRRRRARELTPASSTI